MTSRETIAERVEYDIRQAAYDRLQSEASDRLTDTEIEELAFVVAERAQEQVITRLKLKQVENRDEDLVTDGGTTERPAFVDPNTESVRCHFCGQTWDPTVVDGFDLSDEDDYYPRMVPACPEHAGGCR